MDPLAFALVQGRCVLDNIYDLCVYDSKNKRENNDQIRSCSWFMVVLSQLYVIPVQCGNDATPQ
jgi:hypothetical protein